MTDGGGRGRLRNWTASLPPSTRGLSLLIGRSPHFRSPHLGLWGFKGRLGRGFVDSILARRGWVWLPRSWHSRCGHRLRVPSSWSPNRRPGCLGSFFISRDNSKLERIRGAVTGRFKEGKENSYRSRLLQLSFRGQVWNEKNYQICGITVTKK